MVKTKQEMLDAAYVREVVAEIRRYAKLRNGYALTQAFMDTITERVPVQTELTKVIEAKAKAIQKVEDRYQSKISALRDTLDNISKGNRSWVSEVLRVAAPFFAAWIIQEIAKTGKGYDILNSSKRSLVTEYAKAWIDGWRPALK